ncbi:putative alpha/beta hydrolase domain-containing protein 11 isoform X2 [Apostichopus japonicus]|uniref:sn-1-specific diacylglycerol lipase ABHD11 n=1 Tax=Stichopus japonicus TaxID=307972 RepID=A0A2G8KN23_STIJA|nr:putative alpha/beta hydrolase domain-containing protein 11 isoform X2 [Apostichopus japonicus]
MATRRLLHICMLMRRRPANAHQYNISSKLLHTTLPQGQAIKLSYRVHRGNLHPEQPVVILHGLLGTGKNFDALAKQLVRTTGRTVVTCDARNHGNSDHSDEMSFSAMVADILNLLQEIKAKSCIPIGHSLGGRTAMTLALTKPEMVGELVCIDISPVHHRTNSEVLSFLLAMKKLEIPKHLNLREARGYASEQFSSLIPNKSIRDFILTNLTMKDGEMTWRVNVNAILKNFRELGRIPKGLPPFRGQTLFIGGSLSDYIKAEDLEDITQHFPRSEVKMIEGASHWVHYDKPRELLSLVTEFLNS